LPRHGHVLRERIELLAAEMKFLRGTVGKPRERELIAHMLEESSKWRK
jgi:hypothetical protein